MSSPGGKNPPPSATATISKQVTGTFKVAMSTSSQPAEWDDTLFQGFPSLTTPLGNLQPQHIEVLPVLNNDGSVAVMVANHAINSSDDNNGPGAPRNVLVDVSALGTFSSGTLLVVDADTNAASGPSASSLAPVPQITVTFGGYGVTFLMLKP